MTRIDPNATMPRHHMGSDWADQAGVKMSPLGRRVADMLGEWASGLYHIDDAVLSPKTDLSDATHCILMYRSGYMHFDTVDGNGLTRLVFLAHDYGLRVSLTPHGFGYMRFLFHQREVREGSTSKRCPTIEDALASYRTNYPAPAPAPEVSS